MFREWLATHNVRDYDFSGTIFPKAKDRAFWEGVCDPALVTEAEAYLGCDWPILRASAYMAFHETGDRLIFEEPYFARRRALIALMLGELAEHRGRFLRDMTDGIFAICEESFWGLSAHSPKYKHKTLLLPDVADPYIDLFAAETAELLSVIYRLFYDELSAFCPDLTTRIEYEVERRVLTPYRHHRDFWWMGYGDRKVNNWNIWILSNILTACLLMPVSRDVLCDAVSKLLWEADAYYRDTPEDGGCDEGANYWCKAGGKLLEFCDLLTRATEGKIDFFGDEKIREIGLFIARAYIGNGYFANFADCLSQVSPDVRSTVFRFGKRLGDANLSALARELLVTADGRFTYRGESAKQALYNCIYDKEIRALPAFVPEKARILPDLQTAYLREGSWYLAAKGGSNMESHNHNDVGSFLAYCENEPVLIDPGAGTYTRQTFSRDRYSLWMNQSGWHNLPVVNGREQTTRYEPDFKDVKAGCFTLEGGTVRVSFAELYPPDAELESLERTVTAEKDGITLHDAFVFRRGKNTVSEQFVTLYEPRIDGDRVILGDYVLKAEEPCEISCDSVSFAGDEKLTRCWKQDRIYRVRFGFSCGERAGIGIRLFKQGQED